MKETLEHQDKKIKNLLQRLESFEERQEADDKNTEILHKLYESWYIDIDGNPVEKVKFEILR